MNTASDPAPLHHDVFLSYSRRDREFAALLEKSLENYTPPADLGLPRRRPDVFRDEADFTGTDYPEALRRHLNASGKMIVLCSPAAYGSIYVNEEVRLFAEARGAGNIIPLIISGIPNNEAAPDQQDKLAFPEALLEVMQMPLAADFRGFEAHNHKLHKGVFEGSWFKLLADIYGKERSEIEQREKRRQERVRRMWATGVSLVMLIMLGLTIWAIKSRNLAVKHRNDAIIAQEEEKKQKQLAVAAEHTAQKERDTAVTARKEAEQSAEAERKAKEEEQRQRQIALTRQLASQAELILNQQPNLLPVSVLLAIESMSPERKVPSLEGYQALRHGLSLLPRQVALFQHDGLPELLAFSHDGDFLAVFSRLGEEEWSEVRVWDVNSRRTLIRKRYKPHVRDVALSPGGRFLTVIYGGTIDVWDLNNKSQKMPVRLPGIRTPARLLFSDDGRRLAAVGYEGGMVRVWDVNGWKPLQADKDGPAGELAFSPDGRNLVIASGSAVQVWEVEGKIRKSKCELPLAEIVALSKNGAYVAASLKDRTSGVWKTSAEGAGTRCAEVARVAHQGRVTTVAVADDGKHFSTAGRDGTSRLWSTAERRELARMYHDGVVTAARFSPDGSMFVTAGTDGTVRLWQTVGDSVDRKIPVDRTGTSLIFAPDTGHIVHTDSNGSVMVWKSDGDEGRLVHRLDPPLGSPEDALEVSVHALSPNGRYLALSVSRGPLELWETTSGKRLAGFVVDIDRIRDTAMSPQGDRIAICEESGEIYILRLDGSREPAYTVHEATKMAFSPDGSHLATASRGRKVVLRDLKANRIKTLSTSAPVLHLGFSPDGGYLALRLDDRHIEVWALQRERRIFRRRQDGMLRDFTLSAGGRYLATTADDGVVHIWSVAEDNEIARLVHETDVTALAFSRDGKRIATTGMDNTIRIFRWQPEDMVAEACGRLTRNLTDDEEWRKYLGEEPYRKTCENLSAR